VGPIIILCSVYGVYVPLIILFFSGSDKLNEFIEHYERLVYDTDHLQTAHLRAKRSLDKKPDVTLQFHAHDRLVVRFK